MKKYNNGYSIVEIMLLFVIIGLVVFIGAYVWHVRNTVRLTGSQNGSAALTTKLVRLDESANGKTIDVKQGTIISVELNTTNWTFKPISDPSIAKQSNQIVRQGLTTCRALQDCGNVSVRIQALQRGKAVAQATKEKCGELVYCTGSAVGFSVEIKIN
ncbi:MAG TPA: hypothetical protein VFI84_02070 [Candidatus Saccharimonadales bacterium]|nr:hypothetical protein [Candidatus Saccharimonadales bacterium]